MTNNNALIGNPWETPPLSVSRLPYVPLRLSMSCLFVSDRRICWILGMRSPFLYKAARRICDPLARMLLLHPSVASAYQVWIAPCVIRCGLWNLLRVTLICIHIARYWLRCVWSWVICISGVRAEFCILSASSILADRMYMRLRALYFYKYALGARAPIR